MEIEVKKNKIISSIVICIIMIIVYFIKSMIRGSETNIFSWIILIIININLFRILSGIKIKINDEKTKNKYYLLAFVVSILCSYIMIESLDKNIDFFIKFPRLFFNMYIIFAIHAILYAIINKLNISMLISNIIILILGIINYVVLSFRGSPIVPWDILSIDVATNIASNYTFPITFYFIIANIFFVINIFFIRDLKVSMPVNVKNAVIRICIVILVLISFILIYLTNILDVLGFETNHFVPSIEYCSNGFLASFVKQSKNLITEAPNEYSLEYANEIAQEYSSKETISQEKKETEKPNIIVIMNESFSDLRVHSDFATNEEYIPYFKKISESTISGMLHSSVHGGQTPTSEWEFLTNNSMAFLPYRSVAYQQYIRTESYSLVSTLEKQGYTTYAIHPWYGSGFRRNNIYPLFGFDRFYFLEHLQNELDFIRRYPSDLSTYEQIIKLYENKAEDELFFNFTITMQNHSGYDYEEYESTIKLTEIQNCPNVEQYLSLLKESDEALEYLINYFENVDEKTIIVFFGDHQPPYLEDEFYGYVNGTDRESSEIGAEKYYLTPYFIWANYEIPDKQIEDISLNYLSILLLDIANLETTPYIEFLREVQKEIPVITSRGYMDKNGVYHKIDEENENSELVKKYEVLQYNNVFDTKNRINWFFEASNN